MSTEEMFSRLKLDEEVEILLCAALTLGAPQSAVWAVAQQIGAFSRLPRLRDRYVWHRQTNRKKRRPGKNHKEDGR